jgi:hypothetical protein
MALIYHQESPPAPSPAPLTRTRTRTGLVTELRVADVGGCDGREELEGHVIRDELVVGSVP